MLVIAAAAFSIALLSSGTSAVEPAEVPVAAAAVQKTAAPVDINRASIAELMQVPGITRVWAERIVRFRPYRSKLDLTENGILPGSVYLKIKDRVIAHRLSP